MKFTQNARSFVETLHRNAAAIQGGGASYSKLGKPLNITEHAKVQVCWKCSNGGCCLRRSIGNEMVPLFALLVFCLLGACNCWRSTSQALYGAQISVIRETLRGRSTATPYESLGYLWTYPVNSGDATGLGKSITWAWDPELCGRLMPTFRERCSHDAATCISLSVSQTSAAPSSSLSLLQSVSSQNNSHVWLLRAAGLRLCRSSIATRSRHQCTGPLTYGRRTIQ